MSMIIIIVLQTSSGFILIFVRLFAPCTRRNGIFTNFQGKRSLDWGTIVRVSMQSENIYIIRRFDFYFNCSILKNGYLEK